MKHTNSDDMNFEYFGIDSETSAGETIVDLSPSGGEKLRTLRADSKLRSTEVSAPATERLRSTLSGLFHSLNLNLTFKAKNKQCKFSGHVLPEHHTPGHYPRCSQCGKTITDAFNLRRTSITSGGALNGQVIVPSQDYWVDQSMQNRH